MHIPRLTYLPRQTVSVNTPLIFHNLDQLVSAHHDKLSKWAQTHASKLGLATQQQIEDAKLPIRYMLNNQINNSKASIFNSTLQCAGAAVGYAGAKWGVDILNLFHLGVENLSPELSLIAKTVPISVFMNSLFRIIEHRKTLQVTKNNLANLK